MGAFVSSLVVHAEVIPFAAAQRRDASFTAVARPRPRACRIVPVESVNARRPSRSAVSIVNEAIRPLSIAAKLPSSVNVGFSQLVLEPFLEGDVRRRIGQRHVGRRGDIDLEDLLGRHFPQRHDAQRSRQRIEW